jgi:hypothetical protein
MQMNETAEQAAIKAAEKWLALVDAGAFAETWDKLSSISKSGTQSSSFFKPGISQQQWQSSLADLHIQFGSALSRNLKSKQYAEELPDEPEGEYVVLRYDTSFEHKKRLAETVILLKDRDCEWRVSAYRVMIA